MRATAFSDPVAFLEQAGPLLEADAARHNLILALAWLLHERPGVYEEFGLWVVEEGGQPLAAALITPPHNLVLADAADDRALPVLAAAVRESGLPVPGVLGNRPTVDRFSEAWCGPAGVVPRLHMGLGVFALERVEHVGEAPGAARRAIPADRALVLEWNHAFSAEALPYEAQAPEHVERMIDYRLDPGTDDAAFWLWEDGGAPVSLVGYGGPTPGGARIGPVYTPPEHRRRGYGTALVAAVSAWLLGHGRRRCFLYTDLANPTSNSIYQKIGYRRVAESAEYGFVPAS